MLAWAGAVHAVSTVDRRSSREGRGARDRRTGVRPPRARGVTILRIRRRNGRSKNTPTSRAGPTRHINQPPTHAAEPPRPRDRLPGVWLLRVQNMTTLFGDIVLPTYKRIRTHTSIPCAYAFSIISHPQPPRVGGINLDRSLLAPCDESSFQSAAARNQNTHRYAI